MNHPNLEKCLSLLKNARNDNMKVAALIFFLKHIDVSSIIDAGLQWELYQAIGSECLYRMIQDDSIDSQVRQIGCSMMSFLIADKRVADDPLALLALPTYLSVFADIDADPSSSLTEDTFKILITISSSLAGCNRLILNGAVDILTRVALSREYCLQETCLLITRLAEYCSRLPELEGKINVDTFLASLVDQFSKKFDDSKFILTSTIADILRECQTGGKIVAGERLWHRPLLAGLDGVFRSKLPSARRPIAFELASAVLTVFDLSSVLRLDGGAFRIAVVLIVRLAAVEVQVYMTEQEAPRICGSLLVDCFTVLETYIDWEGTVDCLSEELIPAKQGGDARNALLAMVEQLLDHICCIMDSKQPVKLSAIPESLLVMLRFLLAWIASERSLVTSVESKLDTFLPHLFRLLNNSKDEELFLLFADLVLPGLELLALQRVSSNSILSGGVVQLASSILELRWDTLDKDWDPAVRGSDFDWLRSLVVTLRLVMEEHVTGGGALCEELQDITQSITSRLPHLHKQDAVECVELVAELQLLLALISSPLQNRLASDLFRNSLDFICGIIRHEKYATHLPRILEDWTMATCLLRDNIWGETVLDEDAKLLINRVSLLLVSGSPSLPSSIVLRCIEVLQRFVVA